MIYRDQNIASKLWVLGSNPNGITNRAKGKGKPGNEFIRFPGLFFAFQRPPAGGRDVDAEGGQITLFVMELFLFSGPRRRPNHSVRDIRVSDSFPSLSPSPHP